MLCSAQTLGIAGGDRAIAGPVRRDALRVEDQDPRDLRFGPEEIRCRADEKTMRTDCDAGEWKRRDAGTGGR